MAFNPCPCMPLGRSVKAWAIFDAVFGVLAVFLLIAFLVLVSLQKSHDSLDHELKVIAILILSIYIVLSLFEIGLAMLLLSGANNRSTKKCNIWLVITGIIVGLEILGIISQIVETGAGYEFILLSIWIPFKIYECLVVYSFVQIVNEGYKGGGFVYPTSDTRLLEPGHSQYTPQPQPQ